MAKQRHKNLELPFSEKADPVRRKAATTRARTRRKGLLLIDYQSWQEAMATVPAEGAVLSRSKRGP
ncbi:hypothetical protein [Variovorax sp. KK3]|uniref:hypothetical protein n=1 Tax=Variovorax sp. KK3 TaxID=1855728 RepID=UPI0015C3BD91